MEKFSLGQLVTTSGIAAEMEENADFAVQVIEAVNRYKSGDWGDLCDEDKAENESALQKGERIFALYHIDGKKVYIITEWDRSVTLMSATTTFKFLW